ncbi:hypothetical protein Tsubulata_003124, partial [Turnera subulata]
RSPQNHHHPYSLSLPISSFTSQKMSIFSRLRTQSLHRTRHFSTNILSPNSTTPLSAHSKSRAALSLLAAETNPEKIIEICRAASLTPAYYLDREAFSVAINKLSRSNNFSYITQYLDDLRASRRDIPPELLVAHSIVLFGQAKMLDHAIRTFREYHKESGDTSGSVKCLNSLLFAGVLAKSPAEVKRIFVEFPASYNIVPDLETYNTVIKSFCESGNSSSGYSVLAEMGRKGVKPDTATFTELIQGFYKEEKFEEVEKVLKMMQEEYGIEAGISTYNARIQSLCKLKKAKEAKDLFSEVLEKRLKPNSNTFYHLIHGFCVGGDFEEAKKMYKRMMSSGGKLSYERFNLLVHLFCKGGDFETALGIYRVGFEKKWVPNFTAAKLLVEGLASSGKVEEAKEIVGQMKGRFPNKVDQWDEVEAALPHKMASLFRARLLSIARTRNFTTLPPPRPPRPPQPSYSIEKSRDVLKLIKVEQDPDKIIQICESSSLNPEDRLDRIAFSVAIKKLSNSPSSSSSALIPAFLRRIQLSRPDLHSDTFAAHSIVLLGEANLLHHSILAFKDYHDKTLKDPVLNPGSVRQLNALLFACILTKDYDKAKEIFTQFPAIYNIKPDLQTYNTAIRAYSRSGDSRLVYSVLTQMDSRRVKPTAASFGEWLAGIYSEERFEEVDKVLNLMSRRYSIHPGVGTYNIRIQALCKLRRSREAKALLEGMLLRGMKPNSDTFRHLIHGFCREGDVEEAMRLFKDMRRRGCQPDYDCYLTLLYYLCERGEFEDAYGICTESIEKGWIPRLTIMKSLVEGLGRIGKVSEANLLIDKVKSKFIKNAALWDEVNFPNIL